MAQWLPLPCLTSLILPCVSETCLHPPYFPSGPGVAVLISSLDCQDHFQVIPSSLAPPPPAYKAIINISDHAIF